MSSGFLNARPPAKKAKPAPEDLTHLKSQGKDANLKLKEVQETMLPNKKDWLTPELLEKIAKNPSLLKAFQDPQAMAAMSEFGENPQEAMKKYGDNPEFKEMLVEFSKVMGVHFENIADKKAKEEK
jgi:arsenate reductase-like glutaredoxin family protein